MLVLPIDAEWSMIVQLSSLYANNSSPIHPIMLFRTYDNEIEAIKDSYREHSKKRGNCSESILEHPHSAFGESKDQAARRGDREGAS
jgi:hypothetical protein